MTQHRHPHTFRELGQKALDGVSLERPEALAVLRSGDEELLAVLDAAYRLRLRYRGRRVEVQVLKNAKSGLCGEDCAFCGQARRFATEVPRYPLRSAEEITRAGLQAAEAGAATYCIVTSERGPDTRTIAAVAEAAQKLKRERPELRLCASLGLLSPGQAEELHRAGIDRYNHNLETSARHFPSIVSTHAYGDRVATLERARAAGLELCSGGIIGLGESLEDRVELAFALREQSPNAIPVNFLNPRPGTPLEGLAPPTPADCLRALALFRLVNPEVELRAAGGREACLRSLQPLALFAADSIFCDGYLTTPGQGRAADLQMIADLGFEPSGER